MTMVWGWLNRRKTSEALKSAADALTIPENIKDLRDSVDAAAEILKEAISRIERIEKYYENNVDREMHRIIDDNREINKRINELLERVTKIESFLTFNSSSESAHRTKSIEHGDN